MSVSEQESEEVTSILFNHKMDVKEFVRFKLSKFLLPTDKCIHNEVRSYQSQRISTWGNLTLTLLHKLKNLKIIIKRMFRITASWLFFKNISFIFDYV